MKTRFRRRVLGVFESVQHPAASSFSCLSWFPWFLKSMDIEQDLFNPKPFILF